MKTTRTAAASQALRSAAFEVLESRQMMSVTLDPATHVLTATGTAGSDAIVVSMSGSTLTVNDNGVNHSYAASSVKYLVLNGGDGNDSLRLNDSCTKPSTINGGKGDDFLRGGAGNDIMNGDEGNDVLDGAGANDIMSGGDGIDTADYSARTSAVTVSLDNVANDGKAGETDNVKTDIEVIQGGSGNDYLYGGTTNATLYGNGGADYVYGGSGAGTESLFGGDGNDRLYPHGNTAYVYGGNGDDYINSYATGWTVASGDAGNDEIWGGYGYNSLSGGDGNDVIHGYGSNTNYLYGDAGDDKVYGGGSYVNYVNGGAGNDQLFGGAGVDVMHGNDGDDTLVSLGGGHNDTLYGDNGLDYFWCDNEITETTPDVNLIEALLGCSHRIGSFVNFGNRELNTPSIIDPSYYSTLNTYQPAGSNFSNSPLFGPGGPKEDDIRQGQVGDCYFLAGLSGTAKNDQVKIRNSVVDLGDGTYAVQFKKDGSNVFYRVDADLPVYFGTTSLYYANKGTGGSIWVPIMEKAFTMFRSGTTYTYDSIHGGNETEPFSALGGSSIGSVWGSSAVDTLQKIADALSSGKQVSATTPNSPSTNGCPCVQWHVYTVDHVNFQDFTIFGLKLHVPMSITLRNPWGYDGAGSDSNTSDGYVTASSDQFYNYFVGADAAFV